MNMIETSQLTKISKSQVRVDHLCMKVPDGCVYGFLGPNGAGKSTTLKLLLGLISPTSGSVRILGKTMNPKNRLQLLRQTGSLIESPSFYGNLTGYENMEIVAKLKHVNNNEILEMLHLVRLFEEKDKKVNAYSLGMKQRLGIAMALLGNPRIIFLDEPTNGLDPAGITEIRELIRDLPRKRDVTVIVSSHLLSEMEQMADIVGIIQQGRMIYQGPLADLKATGKTLEEVFLDMTGGIDTL